MDLNSVLVHKLGQYPAILTSHLVNNPYRYLQGRYLFTNIVFVIGIRAGGAGGAAAPPQVLGNSDFLGSKRNLGKASF